MKGMKGRILKKLKSIPHVGYLKQGGTLQEKASDGLSDRILCDLPNWREEPTEPETIEVSKLMRDFKDDETESGANKENIRLAPTPKNNPEKDPIQSEIGGLSFRRPDPNSATLFDPELLAAFQQAVMDHIRSSEEARIMAQVVKLEDPNRDEEPPSKVPRMSSYEDPLMEFEEKCPPGGKESIILYTTSLRGIRKTFEDCNRVRFLFESLKLVFIERDLSMHMEFREELWRVLGGRVIPPRLFIKGKYIGGADEALGLHEQGKLLPLVEGLPKDRPGGVVCRGCGGMRFAVCFECSGSRKVYVDEQKMNDQCRRCNENGLVLCPLCC